MKPDKIAEILNKKIPLAYSKTYCEKFDSYDNSGFLVNAGKETAKILFSLDLSLRTVKKAMETGAGMIVTHHPCIYRPIKSIDADEPIGLCMANGISVYSMHLNLDVSEDGIDENLAKMLGAEDFTVCEEIEKGVGYGKLFSIKETKLKDFVEKIKKDFHTDRVFVYGDENAKVGNIGSFCGGGYETALKYADKADTVVTSDVPHHALLKLVENNKNVVVLTHYACETYPFFKVYESLKDCFDGTRCEFFIDERFI